MQNLKDRFVSSPVGERLQAYAEAHDLKQRAIDGGSDAVLRLVGKFADAVSDKAIPYLNRYENDGFLEGDGYCLPAPAPGARWRVGYAKDSILPSRWTGDLYIAGYLAFPPNKADGVLTDLQVRAFALDDGSGRGIHVFAVIDCIGISNADIRLIRGELRDLIAEKNILSVNISATHCHSAPDTQGVWGSLFQMLKTNPKAVKKSRTRQNAVSGKNPDYMAYLTVVSARTIRKAVEDLREGELSFAVIDAAPFVYDKRPPYQQDAKMTLLRFTPDDGMNPATAVLLAAHPTNYGDKQRQISADFPFYLCDELEKAGERAAFFQGAEAAIGANRGPFSEPGASRNESIEQYGRAIARHVSQVPEEEWKQLPPLLNLRLREVLIPADNPLLRLLGKLGVVSNNLARLSMRDDGKESEICFITEVGIACFGDALTLALIPGELSPEIAYGGAYGEEESYLHRDWNFPPFKDTAAGHLAVIGLCNDAIGYIGPDNDFGSVFAPKHYEEVVSAGGRTASNVAGAFGRVADDIKKYTVTEISQQKEG
ncbi:MAG: hypothetical protein IJJ85_05590 [Clostridia bacterium]|nr:hypothetical protein [Clostridia bacterium]